MFGLIFKGFFFLLFMFWYSIGIWSLVNNYFTSEMRKYLTEEINTKFESSLQNFQEAESNQHSSIIDIYNSKNLLNKNGFCYNKKINNKCKKLTFN